MSGLDDRVASIWGLEPCPINATLVKYESAIIIECAHIAATLACGLVLLCCFSGVQRVTVQGTISSMLQLLPCYRDLEHSATSNTRFVLYYAAVTLSWALSVFALVQDAAAVHRGFRITLQVAQRFFSGSAIVLLTIALNHQREFRHTDSLHGDIGIVQLVGQIRRINYSVAIIYAVYIVTEIATSVVAQTHELRLGMAWFCAGIALVLNLPAIAASLWIAFHKGHVAPTTTARVCLLIGVSLRFIGYFDASFWNRILLVKWAESDPCAVGGVMSFFNLIQILDTIGELLMFCFVVSEFYRSRSIVTQESSLIASAQYDEFGDNSSDHSDGDVQGGPRSPY
jgi:hypothetical protein